ncbi:hypothetical protein PANA5342_3646 [Pantoea ananatis LMG 5342]|nr:hypothetical protein PANA5342_3646 [Pantoea ananatis LMG 5342]
MMAQDSTSFRSLNTVFRNKILSAALQGSKYGL